MLVILVVEQRTDVQRLEKLRRWMSTKGTTEVALYQRLSAALETGGQKQFGLYNCRKMPKAWGSTDVGQTALDFVKPCLDSTSLARQGHAWESRLRVTQGFLFCSRRLLHAQRRQCQSTPIKRTDERVGILGLT